MWVFTKKDLSWSVRERMPSMRCNWAIRSSVCCVAASIVSIAKLIQTIVSSSSPPPQLIDRSGKSMEFVQQYFTLSFRWRKSGAFEGNWGLNLKLNWAILTIEQKWLKWERLRKRKREGPQKERILWWIRSSLPRDIIINLFSRTAWWSFWKGFDDGYCSPLILKQSHSVWSYWLTGPFHWSQISPLSQIGRGKLQKQHWCVSI